MQANQSIWGTLLLILHLEGLDLEASYLTSLNLSFLICKVGIMINLCQSKELGQVKHLASGLAYSRRHINVGTQQKWTAQSPG